MPRHSWKGADTCLACGLRRRLTFGKVTSIYGRTLPTISVWIDGQWVQVDKLPVCASTDQADLFTAADAPTVDDFEAPPTKSAKEKAPLKPLRWERVAPPPPLFPLDPFDADRPFHITFRFHREDYWMGDMKQHVVAVEHPNGYRETKWRGVDTGDAAKAKADRFARKARLAPGARIVVARGFTVLWRLTY